MVVGVACGSLIVVVDLGWGIYLLCLFCVGGFCLLSFVNYYLACPCLPYPLAILAPS